MIELIYVFDLDYIEKTLKKLSSKNRAKGFGPKLEPDPRPTNQQLAQVFDQAIAFHQENNLDKALELYQYILTYRPHNVDTLVNVANIYKSTGKIPEAIALYRRVLESKPDSADTWYNLGNALHLNREAEEALKCYRKSLKLRPNFGGAHFNLGRLLQDTGNLVEAEESYKKAMKTLKDFPPIYTNLGNIAKDSGRLNEAINYHQKALEIDQNYAEGHYHLANTFKDAKAYDLAIKSYLTCLKIRANFPEAWFGLGTVYQLSNNFTGAVGALNLALNYNPKFTEVYLSLAIIKQSQGQGDEAENILKKGIEELPNNYKILNLLGFIYKIQRKADQAEQVLKTILENHPEDGVNHCNLGTLYNDLGMYEQAIVYLEKSITLAKENQNPYFELSYTNLAYSLIQIGKISQSLVYSQKVLTVNPQNILANLNMGWALHSQGKIEEEQQYFQNLIQINPDYHGGHSNYLNSLNYDIKHTPQSLKEAHINWGQKCVFDFFPPKEKKTNTKIKVGYLAPNFGESTLASFLEPILQNHNQDEFEIFCYSNLLFKKHNQEKVTKMAEHWRDIYQGNDQQAAELINADKLDILIDLAGHTPQNRLPLFARKPAPIQITYLGYPCTTGLEAIDYYLTDSLADPPGLTEDYYCETLLRLPNSFLVFQAPENSPPVTDLPAKENKKITFGSFNSLATLTPKVIALWAGILKSIPDSQLILQNISFEDRTACDRCLTLFAYSGIDSRRITLLGIVSDSTEVLALYNTIDIALDPFPYNGTISTCQALWMGVPVITLEGNTHVSRVGVSILTTVGLEEFIAKELKDYLNKTLALVQDLERLSQLRATLRQKMASSPLCDAQGFTRNLETLYRNLVHS